MKKIRISVVVILLISIGILAFYFIPMRITPSIPYTLVKSINSIFYN